MAQRGHELTTQLYIMNQMYSNSEGPNNNANAVRYNTNDRWIEWFLVVPILLAKNRHILEPLSHGGEYIEPEVTLPYITYWYSVHFIGS